MEEPFMFIGTVVIVVVVSTALVLLLRDWKPSPEEASGDL
jgi:hypothetical protein